MFKLTVLCVVLTLALSRVIPPPLHEEYHEGHLELSHACNIYLGHHSISGIDSNYYLTKVLTRLNRGRQCLKPALVQAKEHTPLLLTEDLSLKPEGYIVKVDSKGIQISYSQYSGYVYGLQTMWQLVKDNKIRHCTIRDEPQVDHRGIMVDTARHFLSTDSLKRVIESMPLSKLNILHWHIVDDQSFPIQLISHPQLAQYGSYSSQESYSINDIKDLIKLAKANAVSIIPEIDTPAHVRSWGLAPQWRRSCIACPGGEGYNGQLDVSNNDVLTLSKQVVKEVNQLFADSPYIHLGGDEVSSRCWDLRPEIQAWMRKQGIQDYGQLQMYWRNQLKSVMFPERRVMFWRNNAQKVKIDENDILHFWGSQSDVAKIAADTKAQIVLSPSDLLYINKGQGNIWQNSSQGQYPVWKEIYFNFTVFPEGVDKDRILGAELTLWGEVSNEDTLQNNLWMRSTSFATKVWSPQPLKVWELAQGLVKVQRALNEMGVAASPFTSEFCEGKPDICWPEKEGAKVVTLSEA